VLRTSPNNSATSGAFDVIVWNRPLAQFRSALDFPDPKIRAAAAVARIEFLLGGRRFETIRVQFTELAGQPGARLYAGPHLVFALTEADLNPASGETLPAAVAVKGTEKRRAASVSSASSFDRSALPSVNPVGGVTRSRTGISRFM
jgi:hypothetical protein